MPRSATVEAGPYALTWQVHDAAEALAMARARAVYHGRRHPDLWSTEHVVEWIDRAVELLAREREAHAALT